MSTVDQLADWVGDTLAHHMIEVSPDPVVVLNADDRVVFVSRSANHLQWSRTGLIGTEWRDLVHPDDRGVALARPDGSAGIATTGVVRLRRGDSTWFETRMVRYHGDLHPGSADRRHVSLVVLTNR